MVLAQRPDRRACLHAYPVDGPERSRMEGVLRIPDPLVHRVALDEGVARLPLVREEPAELEQRVRPLPPGRRLLQPKDHAVVERHRPGSRVGIQLLVGDDVRVGHAQ